MSLSVFITQLDCGGCRATVPAEIEIPKLIRHQHSLTFRILISGH